MPVSPHPDFIVCTSLSITYDVFGIATVSYTVMSKNTLVWYPSVVYGDQTFEGYLSSIDVNPVPETDGWYENNVTIICLTKQK